MNDIRIYFNPSTAALMTIFKKATDSTGLNRSKGVVPVPFLKGCTVQYRFKHHQVLGILI